MRVMTFDQHLAAFVLERVSTSDLPCVATRALVEGCDSLDMAALAGSSLGEHSASELAEMFHRGLRQLGKVLPSRIEAGRALRQYYAELVVNGSLEPREGAAKIVQLAIELDDELPSREYVGDGFGVARLIGLHYSQFDVPCGNERAHEDIDKELMSELRQLARGATG